MKSSMDILTFIASIINSISWPLSLLIITIIFRKQLLNILDGIRLKKIKRGDFELYFEQELLELKDKVQVLKLPEILHDTNKSKETKETKQFTNDEKIELISQINPSSAIALVWSNIEDELRNAIYRLAISADSPSYNSSITNINLLKEYNYIDDNTYQILNKLRKLRNDAVHKSDNSKLTNKEVDEFNTLAKLVMEYLRNLKR